MIRLCPDGTTAHSCDFFVPVRPGGRLLRLGDQLVVIDRSDFAAAGARAYANTAGRVNGVLCHDDDIESWGHPVESCAAPLGLFELRSDDRRAAMTAAAQWKWLLHNETSFSPQEPLRDYARIDPTVLALVYSGDHVVVLHRHGAPDDVWGNVAGYIEPGESAEEAVIREVAEETGLTVASTCYVASQSWPPTGSLVFAFLAAVAEKGGTPLTLDKTEHDSGMWITREEIVAAQGHGSAVTSGGIRMSTREVRGLGIQTVNAYLSQSVGQVERSDGRLILRQGRGL